MLVALTMMVTFSACEKDDYINDIDERAVIGTWAITSVEQYAYQWQDVSLYSKYGGSLTFFSDGSFMARGSLGFVRGTWDIDHGVITTFIGGAFYKEFYLRYSALYGDILEGKIKLFGIYYPVRFRARKIRNW